MIVLTGRQAELVRFIQALDESKRHILTITCRGSEPREIMEYAIEHKIQLLPKQTEPYKAITK